MDHIKVLKRAFETTWRYRALWIFGIILALTTGGGGPPSGPNGNGGNGGGGNGGFPPGEFAVPGAPDQIVGILIAVGLSLVCFILLLVIVGIIARWVSETALIRMVDDHEETGEKRSIREGFRLGWSRSAFRLFLINLVTGLPVVVVFIVLFLLVGAPALLWLTGNTVAGIIGTVATVGAFFLVLFLAIIVGVALSLLQRFFWRACALEGLGVIDSLKYGFDFVRRHLIDVGLMWLIMVGIRIVWAIALIATAIVLFPVILLLILLGSLLGGVPALLVGGLASLFVEGAVPWILGTLIGLPIFILIVAAPWIFLSGLMEVFKSSTWTLTYRELRALEDLEPNHWESEIEPEQRLELDEPGLDELLDNS